MLLALGKHWFLSVAQSRAEHHCVETAVPGSTDRPFRIVVAVLAVLMMQALAEQTCKEETSQEESSTLMQLNHRDLDQT